MSVEEARAKYAEWLRIARAHAAECGGDMSPFGRSCLDILWQATEAASIALDNATAHSLVGRRPGWVLPVWLYGSAYA